MAPDQLKRINQSAKSAQRKIYDQQRLERLAGQVIQPMVTCEGYTKFEHMAADAVSIAKALIAELDKEAADAEAE